MRNAFQQFLWGQLSLSCGWYLQSLQRKVLSPQRRSVYGIGLLRRGCNFCVVCPSDEFDGQPPEAGWDIVCWTRGTSWDPVKCEANSPCFDLFCEISSVKHAVNMITVLSHGRSPWYNWDCCKCPINGLFLPILVRLLDITLLCNYTSYILCMAVRSASGFSSTLSRYIELSALSMNQETISTSGQCTNGDVDSICHLSTETYK